MSVFHKAQGYVINNFFSTVEPNRGIDKNENGYYRVFGEKDFEEPGKIEYKLNSYGIRSREFDVDHELVVAGCSFTYGTGIPEHARWSDMLAEKLNVSVANVSFPGAPTEMILLNLFRYLKLKDKDPKYIAVLLPDFLRVSYLRNKENSGLIGSSINPIQQKHSYDAEKDSLSSILPVEWAYFRALDYIKILEIYCKSRGINLVWSTWSTINNDINLFSHNFLYYKKDKTIDEFPDQDTEKRWTEDENQKNRYFEYEGMSCHREYLDKHKDYFYYGYDRLPRLNGNTRVFQPHPGMHRNIHWANFFYGELTK